MKKLLIVLITLLTSMTSYVNAESPPTSKSNLQNRDI